MHSLETLREPKPGIFTFPFLKESEAAQILAKIKSNDVSWKPAHVYGRKNPGKLVPDVRTASVSGFARESDEGRLFDARIQETVRPLIFERWQRDFTKHSGVQLVKYEPGGFYKAHRDNGVLYKNRYYTIVCYLNADFEGGETSFPELDYSVAPEAGKAVVFPSHYLHMGNEVMNGTKYIAVIWMLDKPPISWI